MNLGDIMNGLLLNRALQFIKANTNYSNDEMIKVQYGLEGVFLTISKVLVVFLIGFLFHYLDVIILTLLFFNFLRFFAFGLHAKKSIHCLILSILNFNILPFIMIHITIHSYLIIVVFAFSFFSFLFFAPSDTVKRPLTSQRKRMIRKICSLIVLIILFIVIYYFNYLKVPILCASFIESIMINPISYHILGLPYGNYKNKA